MNVGNDKLASLLTSFILVILAELVDRIQISAVLFPRFSFI